VKEEEEEDEEEEEEEGVPRPSACVYGCNVT
jgi:hypothetical protein